MWRRLLQGTAAHLQQEGEARVAVGHVGGGPLLALHQCRNHAACTAVEEHSI